MSERAELSRKNPYWIPRHRYYELKHFCLQFRDYQHRCLELDGMSNCHPAVREIQNGVQSAGEFTVSQAIERARFAKYIDIIESAAEEAAPGLSKWLLIGVTQNAHYDILKLRFGIPCRKDMYYNVYRRFFYILDKKRE